MHIILIIIILFTPIIYIVVSKSNQTDRQKQLDSVLENSEDFTASYIVKNSDSKHMFCIDDNKRKILYIIANNQIKHLFDFENLISVELIEDSNTTYSKSSVRTIGGGVIGGIIGGGTGAIIGGLSGSNNGVKKVKEILVKILLRNYSTTAIYIECLKNQGIEWDTDSKIYKEAIEEARNISDKLSVIIDLLDKEEKSMLAESSKNKDISITDEIEKLYILKEKGIISYEEFEKYKEKLL